MNYWIIPSNEESFHLEEFLRYNDKIDWRQFNNFEVGDIAYIYVSKPYRRIRYKMIVENINLHLDDYSKYEKFWANKKDYEASRNHNRFVRLHLLAEEPEKGGPSFDFLRLHGLKGNLQSPVRILNSVLLREIRNRISTDSDEMISRICWNSKNWEEPSGSSGKSDIGYECVHGFGHEEWLLDRSKICADGYMYAYLQTIHKKFEGSIDIHLYTYNPDGKRLYVGCIKDAEYVDTDLSNKIKDEYKKKGWLSDMRRQIKVLTGDNAKDVKFSFNVRFRFDNYIDISNRKLFFAKDDPNIRSPRYMLLKKLEPFRFENNIKFGSFADNNSTEIFDPNKEIVEGAKVSVVVNRYERNAEAREKCISAHGCKCSVCGIDFEKVYGEIGKGFIHVHHIKPISEIGKEYTVDPINDLVPVCPNCHAMLHHGKDGKVLTIKELKNLLGK